MEIRRKSLPSSSIGINDQIANRLMTFVPVTAPHSTSIPENLWNQDSVLISAA